jgi:hypothetical protein
MVYVAHIVTGDAGLGATPEVAVTTADTRTGITEPVISYPLSGSARVADAVSVLHTQGWALYGVRRYIEQGYWVAQLRATDWTAIVRAVTVARQSAEIERQCRETAWRTVVDGALRDEHTAHGVIAGVAGISPTHPDPATGPVASRPLRRALS